MIRCAVAERLLRCRTGWGPDHTRPCVVTKTTMAALVARGLVTVSGLRCEPRATGVARLTERGREWIAEGADGNDRDERPGVLPLNLG